MITEELGYDKNIVVKVPIFYFSESAGGPYVGISF